VKCEKSCLTHEVSHFFRERTFHLQNFLILQLIRDLPFITRKDIPCFLAVFNLIFRYKVLAFSPKSITTYIRLRLIPFRQSTYSIPPSEFLRTVNEAPMITSQQNGSICTIYMTKDPLVPLQPQSGILELIKVSLFIISLVSSRQPLQS
jgi:hypothetical protein